MTPALMGSCRDEAEKNILIGSGIWHEKQAEKQKPYQIIKYNKKREMKKSNQRKLGGDIWLFSRHLLHKPSSS